MNGADQNIDPRRLMPPPLSPPVSTSLSTMIKKTSQWCPVHVCLHKDRLMDYEKKLTQKRILEQQKVVDVCQRITDEQRGIVATTHGPGCDCEKDLEPKKSQGTLLSMVVKQDNKNVFDFSNNNKKRKPIAISAINSGPSSADYFLIPGTQLPTSDQLYDNVSAKVATLKREHMFEARLAVLEEYSSKLKKKKIGKKSKNLQKRILKRLYHENERQLSDAAELPPKKVMKLSEVKSEENGQLQPENHSQPLPSTLPGTPSPSTGFSSSTTSAESSTAAKLLTAEEIRACTLLPTNALAGCAGVSGFFCPAAGCTCLLFTVREYYDHLAERHRTRLTCPVDGCGQLFEAFSAAELNAHDAQVHGKVGHSTGQCEVCGAPVDASSAVKLYHRFEYHHPNGQWWCRKGCGYMTICRAIWAQHEKTRCDGVSNCSSASDNEEGDCLFEELLSIECLPVVEGY